ncbi:MAG TPA: hypothetical protein VMV83_03985 [Rectinemataceae bacterium]|nr:hypothetical protein [Rectinemataceae bacterium]
MKVGFCGSCRRLILADFSFCPYCGAETRRGPDLAESVEGPFARIERKVLKIVVTERIDELESQLATMELELESLLEARGASD